MLLWIIAIWCILVLLICLFFLGASEGRDDNKDF